jgi:general secretion pathway protein L
MRSDHTGMRAAYNKVLRGGTRLVRWWLGELGALVPPAVCDRISSRKDLLILALSDRDAVLVRHLSGHELVLGRTKLSAAHEPADTVVADALGDAELRRRIRRGRLRICVRLPAAKALTTHIVLPSAVEENLRQVMDFELDRRTPFAAKDVHFAYRIIERDEAADQIQIELTVVARPVVAAALRTAERFGLTPTIVDVANERGGESGNLLPEDDSRKILQPRILLRRAACVVLSVLAGAALYRPAFVAHQAAAELARQVQDAKRVAAEVVRLRDETTQLDGDERYLIDYRRRTPTVSELLRAVTHALPDDTWLAQLTLTASEVQLSGFSTSASSLLQPIGQSPLFAEPRFRSAVVFDTGISRERFEMAMTVIKRGAP